MPFADNITFACLALDGPVYRGPAPAALNASMSVYPDPPVELDDVWTRWLGTIQAGTLQRSAFFIVGQWPGGAAMQDSETGTVAVECAHRALLLQGFAYCSGGLLISGNTEHGLHVGPISTYLGHPSISLRRMRTPTNEDFAMAGTVAHAITSLYSYKYRFMRIRRGFYAWFNGVRESSPGFRLHFFIRAIEALTQAPRGQLGLSFRTRSQLFIGGGLRNQALLRQLYDLRSCMEHTKWWRSEINCVHGLNVEESLSFRALQAEMIASAAYLRILSSPVLLNRFATERTIRSFWALGGNDREKLWGEPFNVRAAASQALQRLFF